MSPRPWLSPEDYARLSPHEKSQLWRERGKERPAQRHNRQYRPRRKRMPYWQRKLIPLLIVVAAIPVVGWVSDRWSDNRSRGAAQLVGVGSSAGERVQFGLCVWGGGTNCVVDGDTIYLHGVKIRIAGIDAPETHDFKCADEKNLGDRATMRLQQLLNNGAIRLTSIDRDEDVYGRKLRNVSVDGKDVGDALISDGLARGYYGRKTGWC